MDNKLNSCETRIAIDNVPGKVASAIQYLTKSPWATCSKILSQLSDEKSIFGSKAAFNCPIENANIDKEETLDVESSDAPYDRRPLRLLMNSSTDILDGASESSPAIFEAACILDSSIPVALRGKTGRQGMISLQKTLAVLATRQLALPLGKLKTEYFRFI